MNSDSVDPANVLKDGLGDWRFRWVQKIERNGRPALASAPGELQAPDGQTFTFTDFMPTALFLNIAMGADERANQLRGQLRPEEFMTRSGLITELTHDRCSLLFDFIEQSSVAVINSCQALEAYCNFTIRMRLGDGGHIFKLPKKPKELVNAVDIERYGDLMEKMKTVVPHLLKIQPPTGEPFWSRLWEMKALRDALVHPKFPDQMAAAERLSQRPGAIREDSDSAYYKIVSGRNRDFSKTAAQALDYFTREEGTPRWLLYPLEVAEIAPTAAKLTHTITISTSHP